MKRRKATILCFLFYLLAAGFYTYVNDPSLQDRSTSSPAFKEITAGPMAPIAALAYAGTTLGDEMHDWLGFIGGLLIVHLSFFVLLKLFGQVNFKKLVILPIVSFSLSFIVFLILHDILWWVFGLYFSISVTLGVVTYFILRWEELFVQEVDE